VRTKGGGGEGQDPAAESGGIGLKFVSLAPEKIDLSLQSVLQTQQLRLRSKTKKRSVRTGAGERRRGKGLQHWLLPSDL
jgi:hypothetical protein